MARRSKMIISLSEFKNILLDRYVDEDGKKVSSRLVWNDVDFMEKTGMYQINKYTNRKERSSEGTISYYNSKLGLTELNLYKYHTEVTKRIPKTMSYDEWSRKFNKGYTIEHLVSREFIKNKIIEHFGLNETFKYYSNEKIFKVVERLTGKEALKQFLQDISEKRTG